MDGKRVVITGVGVISPIGNDKETFWNNLVNGVTGVDRITRFDPTDFNSQIAAEVKDFNPEEWINKKEAKRMDRFSQFAVAASVQAVQDAGITEGDYAPEEIGVMVGSGIGGIETIEEQHKKYLEAGPNRLSPFLIPMLLVNLAAGLVSIRHGFKGPNTCVATACATGTHAIGDAFEVIRRGDAKAMIAGGTEAAITPLGFGGFCAMKAMSTRNDDPKTASRPFDKERDGFVMGEGCGLLMLEEYESAKKRGAKIYGELVGYGMTGDAYHMTAPSPGGEGGGRAMKKAMAQSGLPAETFNYVNAHGTSTPLNDKLETMAVKLAYGEDLAQKIMVCSSKCMTGHLLAAAGGVEAIVCALTLERQVVPPTINQIVPDPECDLDCVPNTAREVAVTGALCNSLGFGGHNATIALRKI